jgi:hypothetical protein
MNAPQKLATIAILATSIGIAIYEERRAATIESEVQVVRQQNASFAAQAQQPKSAQDGAGVGADGAEPHSKLSNPDTSELLRLRGEVGLLRHQLAAASERPQTATNQISFAEPYLTRGVWSDHGTDNPQNTILTMFWALSQGDESKLEEIVSRARDSQTLDQLVYPKNQWEKISAIQVVKVAWARAIKDGKPQDVASAEVILEKAAPRGGGDKDLSMERWSLTKMNDHWLITGWH